MRAKRVLRWVALGALALLGLVVIVVVLAVVLQTTDPFAPAELRRVIDEANQSVAIEVAHGLDGGKARRTQAALFDKVERGEELDERDSAAYRVAYQGVLEEARPRLASFDHDLTPATDVEMERPNNVGGSGIAGIHDHHDFSTRANLADLGRELAEVTRSGASGAAKIRNAILAYKDLADVIGHLGTVPHTKSTPYLPPMAGSSTGSSWVEQDGEALLAAFKKAQFAPVGSPAYWTSLFAALDRYDDLILRVQAEVNGHLGPLGRKLVGRFGSWQSLGFVMVRPAHARRYRP
jgi:hypothetical protein